MNIFGKRINRILSVFLAAVIIITAAPFVFFAEEGEAPSNGENDGNEAASPDIGITIQRAGEGGGEIEIGSGEKFLTGLYKWDSDNEKTAVAQAGDINIKIAPNEDSYIQSVTVGDEDKTPSEEPDKRTVYELVCGLSSDTVIRVLFAKLPVNSVTVVKEEHKSDNDAETYNKGGQVIIDGAETEYLEYKQGEEKTFTLSAVPDEGHLIESVSVGGEVQDITDETAFTKEIVIPAGEEVTDTEIKVVFVRLYTLQVFKDEGGSVFVNGTDTEGEDFTGKYKLGTALTVKAIPDQKHIFTLEVNGTPVDTENNEYTFVIEGNTWAAAAFIPLYTVSVKAGENGAAIITAPETEGGTVTAVTVPTGTEVRITATPNENYRIFSVKGTGSYYDGEYSDNSYTGDNPLEIVFSWLTEDHEIEISFAPMIFEVKANIIGSGSVTPETALVNYGDDCILNIGFEEGCFIESITVNGENAGSDALVFKGDNTAEYSVKNITENIFVCISLQKAEYADMEDFSWEKDKAVRITVGGKIYTYIFKENDTVKFSTEKEGIKLYFKDGSFAGGFGAKEITLNSDNGNKTKEIESLWLFYGNYWHEARGEEGAVKIKLAFDSQDPVITLAKPDGSFFYGGDVILTAEAWETGENPSGTGKVEYVIEGGGERESGILYAYDKSAPVSDKLSGLTLTVNSEKFNCDNIKVTVTVTDLAGNSSQAEAVFSINTDEPQITITVSGTKLEAAKEGYFTDSRTAVITVMDRNSTFDEGALKTALSAKDKNGKTIHLNSEAIISGWKSDGENRHICTLSFTKEGIYSWSLAPYTNRAGKAAEVTVEGEAPFEFTIDKTAPKLTLTSTSEDWTNTVEEIIHALTFGIYKKSPIKTTAKAEDALSPLYGVVYYRADAGEVLDFKALEDIYGKGGFAAEPIVIDTDDEFVIYARACDYAGNVTYKNTDRMIFDSTDGIISLIPDSPHSNEFYNRDFGVEVTVDEEKVPDTAYSGIEEIVYKIVSVFDGEETVTREETLYRSDRSDPHKKQWEGVIPVIAAENNSDNVRVIVTVTDNAGNVYSGETEILSVNIDAPQIYLDFGNDSPVNIVGGRGYFGRNRTAVLTVIDRDGAFDEEAITGAMLISAVDSKGEKIGLDLSKMISGWRKGENENEHKAVISFTEDGNYTFNIAPYVNKAGNSAETEGNFSAVDTGNSAAPFEFTIDKEKPAGTLTVDTSAWEKFLEKLTFGIFKSKKVSVTVKAEDGTSPFDIEYLTASQVSLIGEGELEELYRDGRFSDFEGSDLEENGISPNQRIVIYIRITDYSGNYIYLHSDGVILDDVNADIALTAEAPNGNGSYNHDIMIDVSVSDAAPYSGIKTVEYWVESDGEKTQDGVLFDFAEKNPEYKDLLQSWQGSFTVSADLNNNSDNVMAYVRAVDNAGNESLRYLTLDIDVTKPVISLAYTDKTNEGAKADYYRERTATVTITERTDHFDPTAAADGITITAVDSKGNTVSEPYSIGQWVTRSGDTPDKAVHTAVITFIKDANYTLDIDYTDKAGNRADSIEGKRFTVDRTAPAGVLTAQSAEGRTDSWDGLRDVLTFGFWSNSKISLTQVSDDETSPIASVMYYMISSDSARNGTVPLDKAELDKVTDWRDFTSIEITDNRQFTVYLKITDNGGNYRYISSNGLIVDNTRPDIESAAPMVTVTPVQPVNGIYNGDVRVNITVSDPLTNGTYSGLREVAYRVFDRNSPTPDTPTQEGTLFAFNGINPSQNELVKSFTREITVIGGLNNSNDIQVVVYAEDNAGNTADNSQKISQSYLSLKIDTTAPVINISYDNNNADNDVYFRNGRRSAIVITERNFNPDDVKVTVTSTEGVIPELSGWTNTEGVFNGDGSAHTAYIDYTADGDYTFSIEYTDMAGNKCTQIIYSAETRAGESFTIDKTKPVIDVVYDNNNPQNGSYYNDERTAAVTVTEHNFSTAGMIITMTAEDDGIPVLIPTVSVWNTVGDTHTAVINYKADALYTFDIAYTDMAGNEAEDYTQDVFYIDKQAPVIEITGIKDKSANNGDVMPVITLTDTNFDKSTVSVVLNGSNRGENLKYENFLEDIKNGEKISYSDFPKEKEYDDLYTLTVSLSDMAGNMSRQTVAFSANRFGSVYDLTAVGDLLNKYLQSEQDIIFTEINVNGIQSGTLKIKLTKNGIPADLVSGEDYEVVKEGGEGDWSRYLYTISKTLFEDDGKYDIFIYTMDEAGNINENIDEAKGAAISFGVDKTAPVIAPVDLESGRDYAVEMKEALADIKDNLVLGDVKVYLNEKEIAYTVSEESHKFNIPQSGSRQTVRIVALDAAGNRTEEVIENILVSTDMFVRWYNNTPLFIGTIAGACVLAIGVIAFLLFGKRRKRAEK